MSYRSTEYGIIGKLFKCLNSFSAKTASGLNAIGSIWVCLLMILICSDVLSRGLLNKPIAGVAEIIALSIVALVFLQLSHSLVVGSLTRIDLFVNYFSKGRPKLKAFLSLFTNIIGLSTFATIFVGSYSIFLRSWISNEFVGVQGTFTAPTWPAKLSILVGCSLMCLQFLLFAVDDIREIFRKSRDEKPTSSNWEE